MRRGWGRWIQRTRGGSGTVRARVELRGLRAATRDGGDDDPRRVAIEAQANTKLPGAATMCVVRLKGTSLTCANVGDSGFRVVRDGAVAYGSTAGQHYFNCPYQLQYRDLAGECDAAEDADVFSFDVREGDIVVAGSDGLFDNVFDEEIASVRRRRRGGGRRGGRRESGGQGVGGSGERTRGG